MARPLLIIDMGEDSVRACALSPGKGSAEVYLESPIEGGDIKEALTLLLKEMEAAGFAAFGRVYLGVPSASLSMRVVHLPLGDKKKVVEILPFELEDRLVRGTEDFIFEAVPLSDGSSLAVALEKSYLREYLNTLAELSLEPFWVGSSLLAKERLLAGLNGGAGPAAFIDNESIIISDNKGPLLYKRVRDEMDIKLALAGVEAEGLEIKTFYYCGERAKALVPSGCEARAAGDLDERFTGLRALVLQIEEGLKGAVNFRKGEFANTEAFDRASKGFRVTVALVATVALLWGALVYIQSRHISTETAQIKGELYSSYRRAFPAEATVQDPLYQLEIKLKEQAGDMALMGRGVDVLENMRLLSEAGGRVGITLYELSMSGRRVTAKGKAPSFDKAVKFKDELLKLNAFKKPVLTDVKTSVSGGVTFSIALDNKGVGSLTES